MIIINFAHPLTEEHIRQVEALSGQQVNRLIAVPAQVDTNRPLAPQVSALVDSCGISTEEWQTLPLLINPPSLNFIAVILLAELHGRCGYFPAHIRLRPVHGSTPLHYEVAEILNLQSVRDNARVRR